MVWVERMRVDFSLVSGASVTLSVSSMFDAIETQWIPG